MKRIPSLDGLRALSIILILFCHSRLSAGFPNSSTLTDIAKQAEVGVTIFFVISGFLITTLLLNEEAKNGRIDVKSFYIRRAFRILPVALLYIIFISYWKTVENIGLSNANIIQALTFTVNFSPSRGSWFVGHYWSLSVEEQFYLIWPTLFLICRKHLKIVLVAALSYSCFIRAFTHHFSGYDNVSLSPFFSYSDAIFIGALGALLNFNNPAFKKHRLFSNYLMQLISFSLIITLLYFEDKPAFFIVTVPFENLFISIAILFFIFAYITPSENFIFKLLNCKAAVHVGVLSYSIYIWQQFFFVGELTGFWRTFPYNILVIYVVSSASYYLWELPFLQLKRRFSASKQQLIKT